MSSSPALPFGDLLKQLRKRTGMTQGDLGAALGYSAALISALECHQRLPDLDAVIHRYIPALALDAEPHVAVQLVEAAAHARGERPPAAWTLKRERQQVIDDEEWAEPQRPPLPPTELIGRAQEVDQLGNRLLGHGDRLLTLVGPPGIGKTRLALAVAAQLQVHYRQGAVFVPLAAVGDAATLASAILVASGAGDAGRKPPRERLIEFLRRQSLLLVLDNFEQLLAPALQGQAVTLVADLLAQCPGVVVLATSRERLHLRAEQRYQVPPLSLPAAVALFTARATAVNATFAATGTNCPLLAAICQRLDCLPLAIELCAAHSDLLAPAQLLAQLQTHTLSLLIEGAHDLPPRQRTLRTAIEHSYRLLSEEQRTIFRRLGVFAGGFDLEAAEMVARADVSTLRSLVNKSLVHVEATAAGTQRFLLLETLREFALEQLHAHGEKTETRQRHYAAYLQLFRAGDGHLRGPESATWLARMQLELNNLRAALHWAFDPERYTDAAWLLIAPGFFWYLAGQRYEEAHWSALLLPHRQALAVDLRLAFMIGFIYSAGDAEETPSLYPYIAEIHELMEICSDKHLHALAWNYLSWFTSDVEQTAAALDQAVASARLAAEAPPLSSEFGGRADHDYALGTNLWSYANFLMNQGRAAEATTLVTESLQIFRRRGNQPYLGECLGTLGFLAFLRNDTATARHYWQEVVTIGKTHNLPMLLCEWQPLLGIVALYTGDLHEAKALLEHSLQLCRQVKSPPFLAQVYTCLAETALWEEDWEQAAHCLAQGVASRGGTKHMFIGELFRLFTAVRLAAAQSRYLRAAILAGVTEAMQRQTHNVYAGPALPLFDTAVAQVRATLEPAVFAEAFAAGRQLSLDEAFAAILAPGL